MIVDMSSSVVARGRIILAAIEGRTIPKGWEIDEEGVETTDASAALKGAVLPFGGAKSYALAMAVEVMSGVLSGAAFGPHVTNLYNDDVPPANVGHSFIVLDIAHWMPLEDYYARVDQLLKEIKAVPRASEVEEIFYPGERRYLFYLETAKEGVALPIAVQEELDRLAVECGTAFPSPVGIP